MKCSHLHVEPEHNQTRMIFYPSDVTGKSADDAKGMVACWLMSVVDISLEHGAPLDGVLAAIDVVRSETAHDQVKK